MFIRLFNSEHESKAPLTTHSTSHTEGHSNIQHRRHEKLEYHTEFLKVKTNTEAKYVKTRISKQVSMNKKSYIHEAESFLRR